MVENTIAVYRSKLMLLSWVLKLIQCVVCTANSNKDVRHLAAGEHLSCCSLENKVNM